jgi:hypothetical protein
MSGPGSSRCTVLVRSSRKRHALDDLIAIAYRNDFRLAARKADGLLDIAKAYYLLKSI